MRLMFFFLLKSHKKKKNLGFSIQKNIYKFKKKL